MKSKKSQLRAHAVAVAVLLGWPACPTDVLATNGIEPIGVGQPAASRGGADVAVGDTAFSQILNPATLSFRLRPELDVGLQVLLPRCRYQNALNDDSSRIAHIEIPAFTYAAPINDKLSWGATFHGKAGLATSFKLRQFYPPFFRHEATSKMIVVGLGLNGAYKINDKLSIGAGIRMETTMLNLDTGIGPLNLQCSQGMGFGLGYQVGLTYKPIEKLTLGAAYHSPTWMHDVYFDEVHAAVVPLRVSLGSGSLNRPNLPQKLILGASYDINERWKIMGEARWVDYSNSMFHNRTLAADLLGSIRVPFNQKWKDAWVFMIGTEYKLTDEWTVSTGYNYGNTSMPGTHLLPICAGIPEHHLTAGGRYDKKKWWVGLGWVHAFTKTLRGSGPGRLPFNAVPISWDYGSGASVSHGQDSIMLSAGFRF